MKLRMKSFGTKPQKFVKTVESEQPQIYYPSIRLKSTELPEIAKAKIGQKLSLVAELVVKEIGMETKRKESDPDVYWAYMDVVRGGVVQKETPKTTEGAFNESVKENT